MRKARQIIDLSGFIWRRGPESNRTDRICNPGHNRFATAPKLDCLKGNTFKQFEQSVERETRLELATSTLARLRSTN